MGALAAADVLATWEVGRDRHAVDRALLLLHVAHPGRTFDDLCQLPLGVRDAMLLELHLQQFGDALDCVADCPTCATPLDVRLSARELIAGGRAPAAWPDAAAPLSWRDRTIDVRAPHSLDLAATVAAGPDAGLATILQRCITVLDGDPLPAIDDALVAEVSQRIAALDPVAEILIQLQCPDCDAAWSESLDVVEQIWAGVQARARRLLREVDVLARAYGWSERQILSLSHARRQAYLEICQG